MFVGGEVGAGKSAFGRRVLPVAAPMASQTEAPGHWPGALHLEGGSGGGLEPPMTGPEPVVLPITPPPNGQRHMLADLLPSSGTVAVKAPLTTPGAVQSA